MTVRYPLFWLKRKNIGAYIAEGRFQRSDNKAYQSRLAYTQQLKTYLCDQKLMNKIFCNPRLKNRFFRAFGYQGQLDFTIYPNSWIRDLPLLDIGKGVYLGEHILLGTNQVEPQQDYIRVGPIKIGAHTIFDQYCMVALKTIIGEHCQFAIANKIGLSVRIGDRVKSGAGVTIGHKSIIGNDVLIEDNCFIGSFSKIEAGAIVREHSNIPSFSLVTANGDIHSRKNSAQVKHKSDVL